MNESAAEHAAHSAAPSRGRCAGAILWPSFFAAAVATVLTFAFIDPLALRDATFPDLPLSREVGYTIGFFLFWLCTAASSLFTHILLCPASRFNKPLRGD